MRQKVGSKSPRTLSVHCTAGQTIQHEYPQLSSGTGMGAACHSDCHSLGWVVWSSFDPVESSRDFSERSKCSRFYWIVLAKKQTKKSNNHLHAPPQKKLKQNQATQLCCVGGNFLCIHCRLSCSFILCTLLSGTPTEILQLHLRRNCLSQTFY